MEPQGRHRVSARRWWWVVLPIGMLCVVDLRARADSQPSEWRVPSWKARQQNPIPPDRPSLAAGLELYQRECLSCHGVAGKGDGPAAGELERSAGDLSSRHAPAQLDGELFWKITIGRTPMPGFKTLLSEEERWHVVNYLRTLENPPDVPAHP
jgi:mono/diheme cytochrome c family protein